MKKTALFLILILSLFICGCSNKKEEQKDIIVTKALMQIAPEYVPTFKQVIKGVVKETLKEKGCLNYAFYQDAADSTKFFLYEEYTNQEALDFHLAQPYLVEFRKARKKMVVGNIPYTIFDSKTKLSTVINSQKTVFKLDK